MVATVKNADCRVGTTTNGMLLNRETIKRVVESGMDVIAFSLAGTGEENDRIRKGTRLTKVLVAMRALNEEREKRRMKTPAIHVAYMLFQSGLRNLRNLPGLLRGCGAADVVISFLDFIPCEELKSEVISPAGKEEYEELQSLLEEVKEEGNQHQLSVHHPLESMEKGKEGCTEDVQGCTENVQRAVCIASDGSVTPCVYTNLQVSGASYMPSGGKREYERMVFGNIQERPLKAIWRAKGYSAFRHSFQNEALSPTCLACPKLRRG